MNRRSRQAILHTIIAGVTVDYIQLTAYYFLYPHLQKGLAVIVVLVVCSSVLLVSSAICRGRKTFGFSLLCWMISILSFVFALVLNGYLGTVDFVLSLNSSIVNEATQNAAGLLIFISSIATFGIVFLVILVKTLLKRFNR